MSRFKYAEYDDIAKGEQSNCLELCEALEREIEHLHPGRSKSMALTKLEETYMWIGKAIRDGQFHRDKPPISQGDGQPSI